MFGLLKLYNIDNRFLGVVWWWWTCGWECDKYGVVYKCMISMGYVRLVIVMYVNRPYV